MGTIDPQSWLEYIARQTKIPPEKARKRLTIEYWKDHVGFHDLGIFVAFLEAIDVKELMITPTDIVCNVRAPGVTAAGTNVRLTVPKKYYDLVLGMEYSDKFKLVDATGKPYEVSESGKKLYTKKREEFLKLSRINDK